MALALIVTNANNTQQIPISGSAPTNVTAQPNNTYRVIDTATGKTPSDVEIIRNGDDVVIRSASNNIEVTVKNFMGEVCSAEGGSCTINLDVFNPQTGEYGQALISQNGQVLEHLLAGQVGQIADGAVLTSTSSATGLSNTELMAGLGIIGAAGLALAGGGGGGESDGSSEDNAPSPQPNRAPTLTLNTSNNFTEDAASNKVGSVVASFSTADVDGDRVSVTLSDTTNYSLDGNNVVLTKAGLNKVNNGTDLPEFSLTSNDGKTSGTAIKVDPSVTAVNDAAVIKGDTTGTAVEDGKAITGTLKATDVDNTDNTFTASRGKATYGSFAIVANGKWTYTLDNANAKVDKLITGDKLSDSFNVKSVDGTAQTVSITIKGVNDAPTLANTTIEYKENQQITTKNGKDISPILKTLAASDVDGTIASYHFLNSKKQIIAAVNGISTSEDGHYSIDSSGNVRLTVKGGLLAANSKDSARSAYNDYETGKNEFKYSVVAVDNKNKQSATATITLKVTDNNVVQYFKGDVKNDIKTSTTNPDEDTIKFGFNNDGSPAKDNTNYHGSTLNTYDGDDAVVVNNTNFKGATLNTGAGNDSVTGDSLTLDKSTFNSGDGDDSIDVDNVMLDDATIDTGAGKDSVKGDSLTLKNKSTLNTGDGDDSIDVKNVTLNDASIDTGAGKDSIKGDSLTLNNKSTLNTGDGDDSIGVDNVTLNDATINTGEGKDSIKGESLTLEKSTLNTGDNDDSIDVDNVTLNDATIDTGAGNDSVKAELLDLNKSAFNTGDGDDTVDVTTIQQGNIDTGTGKDKVEIDSINATGDVNVSMGDDNDTLQITKAIAGGHNIVFEGGKGDDTLVLGSQTGDSTRITLNLSQTGSGTKPTTNVTGFENINLGTKDSVILTLGDVKRNSNANNELFINSLDGASGNSVVFNDSRWTKGADQNRNGIDYHVYTAKDASGTTYTLFVNAAISTQHYYDYKENVKEGDAVIADVARLIDSLNNKTGYRFVKADGSLSQTSEDGFYSINVDGKVSLTTAGGLLAANATAPASEASNNYEQTPNTFAYQIVAINSNQQRSAAAHISFRVDNVIAMKQGINDVTINTTTGVKEDSTTVTTDAAYLTGNANDILKFGYNELGEATTASRYTINNSQISTSDGDDIITSRLYLSVQGSAKQTSIDLGADNDYLEARDIYGEEGDMLINMGSGEDIIKITNEIAFQKRATATFNMGSGDDKFMGNNIQTQGKDINIDTQEGNDVIEFVNIAFIQDISKGQFLLTTGAGEDVLNLKTLINTITGQPYGGQLINYGKNGGNPITEIDMGTGDDVFTATKIMSQNAPDSATSDSRLLIKMGTGDDELISEEVLAYNELNGTNSLIIDMGIGNDTLTIAKDINYHSDGQGNTIDSTGYISGNDGTDTLILGDGTTSTSFDLGEDYIKGFEKINLKGNNTLGFELADLVDIAENKLYIEGTGSDKVDLGNNGATTLGNFSKSGTQTVGGMVYNVYDSNSSTMKVYIDVDITNII